MAFRGPNHKGGRPSKGSRYQTTIRIPMEIGTKIEDDALKAGYTVNDYFGHLIAAALDNGLAPPAVQQSLPMTA
jgi:hypothetical protein